MKVPGTDHVQLAMSKGSEDRARGFYGKVLGMKETPKPQAVAGRRGCWFASGAAQVHLGVAYSAWSAKHWTRFPRNAKPLWLPTRPDADRDGRRRVRVFEPFGVVSSGWKPATAEAG